MSAEIPLSASETLTLPGLPSAAVAFGLGLTAITSDSISGLSMKKDSTVPAEPAPMVEAMTSSALARAAVSPFGAAFVPSAEPIPEYFPDIEEAAHAADAAPPPPKPPEKYTTAQKRMMLVGAILLGVFINLFALWLNGTFDSDPKPKPVDNTPTKAEKPRKRPAPRGDS